MRYLNRTCRLTLGVMVIGAVVYATAGGAYADVNKGGAKSLTDAAAQGMETKVLGVTVIDVLGTIDEDAKGTGDTFAPAPGSRVIQGSAIDVPELGLPEPGSFTGGPTCDTCPGEAGCTILDGVPVAGDTTGNTASGEGVTGACGPDGGIIDAFYTYNPSCTGLATAVGTTAGGPAFVMAHGTTDLGCNALIACDDTGVGITFSVFVGDEFELRIGNAVEGAYTFSVTCAPSVCDNGVFEPGEDCDPSSPAPNDFCADGTPCPADCQCAGCPASEITDDCNGTISQSTSTDVTAPAISVSCGAGQPGNNWARCFDGPTEGWSGEVTVDSATFEPNSALDGSTACINIYAIDSCDNVQSSPSTVPLAPIATECITVNAADANTLVTIVFANPPKIPDGMDIIVEVNTNAGAMIAEQNTLPECDFTYIRADACGLTNWLPMGAIGFPASHLNLTAEISCNVPAECGNGIQEPGEECDGADAFDCPGECLPDCTCPVKGGDAAVFFTNPEEFASALAELGKVSKAQWDWTPHVIPGAPAIQGLNDPMDINNHALPVDPWPTTWPPEVDNVTFQANLDGAQPAAPNPHTPAFPADQGLVLVDASAPLTNVLVAANFFDDSYDIISGPPAGDNHTAISMEVASLLGSGVVDVTVYDKNEGIQGKITVFPGEDAEGKAFLGIIMTQGLTIGRVNLFDPEGGAEGVTAFELWQLPGGEIPTVSEWGMIALTLLLLAVGGRMIVRRRQLA